MRPLLAALLLACLAGGCVRVQPWRREIHARRAMQPSADPAEAQLDGHVEEYREGSIGGRGAAGGGCGCN